MEIVHRPQTQVVYLSKSCEYLRALGNVKAEYKTLVKVLQRHVETKLYVKALPTAQRLAEIDDDPVNAENVQVRLLTLYMVYSLHSQGVWREICMTPI